MLKIVLAAILVTLCALIGFAVERVYKIRLKMLEEYREFIRYVERETEFLKTDLRNLVQSFDCCSELKKLLDKIVSELNLGQRTDYNDKYLKEAAVKEMYSFIINLANSDYIGKNAVVKHALCIADELAEKAKKEKIQKGEMVRKLMILLGVALVVITI